MSRLFAFLFFSITSLPLCAQLLPEDAKSSEKAITSYQKTTEIFANAKQLYDKEKYSESYKLFTELAEQGHAEAQAYIGLMFELGQGTKKDFQKAFKHYQTASDNGVTWAQYNLGLAYAHGRGVEQSDTYASKMFRLAALGGSIKSQEHFASRYDQGLAPPQEGLNAAQWLNPSNLLFIADLKKDFSGKLHFESSDAEQVILDFDIRCRSQMDNRYLPLVNLLLARLSAQNGDGVVTETFVIKHGEDTRVIDRFKRANGETFEQLVFQINQWGELMLTGKIKKDAILNACFTSYGPIWLLEN